MKILIAFTLALFTAGLMVLPDDADARRFGGGRSLGKQFKSMPRTAPRPTRQTAPGRSQAAAAAAGRGSGASRWLGPLAGLAAGGLLASLFFGDAFEGIQLMDILLIGALVVGGLMLFKAMRRSAPVAAGAGPGRYGGPSEGSRDPVGGRSSDLSARPGSGSTPAAGDEEAPAWFDGPGFVERAKAHFIRLQAAWDEADLRDIQEYTTPELFAELQRERSRLGEEAQYTEVVTLEAEIVGVRRDGDQLLVSVLFSGLIREERSATADPFGEIWHVRHAWDSSDGDWLIAGVQQASENSND
jgi:predicted lipid-binding transport protein (Tim44 family)